MPTVYNKVTANGTTLIDLSQDTVTQASHIVSGYVGHLADGTQVTGSGGGSTGVDIPVFTVTWDSNWDNVVSVTCNKTYAECASLINDDVLSANVNDTNGSDVMVYAACESSTEQGSIRYAVVGSFSEPLYDVIYNSNGTIQCVYPSSCAKELNIEIDNEAEDDTYYPQYGVFTKVDVEITAALENHYVFHIEQDQTDDTIFLPVEPFSEILENVLEIYDPSRIFIIPELGNVKAAFEDAQQGTQGYPPLVIGDKIFTSWITYKTIYESYVQDVADKIVTITYLAYGYAVDYQDWQNGVTTGSLDYGVRSQVTLTYPLTPQTKSVSYTPTESAQSQTVSPDNGYTLSGVNVSVGAISSSYVGSGVTRRSSSDLTASGATVTAPSGYYSSNATKTISSGTEGTPTATKGTVSNHSVSVTPSVTNTTGYITGSTKTGTAVTVSASELVSGTYTVDSSGTKDVTNYASASVPSGTAGTPSASKGTVSNHAVTVTPSVTNSTGWITGSTKTGTAVSVSASELVSGSETKTANGTYDVTNLASLVVAIPFSTITTSSSNPTGGNNGDVWIKTS